MFGKFLRHSYLGQLIIWHTMAPDSTALNMFVEVKGGSSLVCLITIPEIH